MPWEERSFMVETKPQAEYSSLYVACIENDPRDIVRIVQNGIDLCSSNDIGDVEEAAGLVVEKLGDLHLNRAVGENVDSKAGSPAATGDVCSPLTDRNSPRPKKTPSPVVVDEKVNKKDNKENDAMENVQNTPDTKDACASSNGANKSDNANSKSSLCAFIKGMRLDPESVKNYLWTDDQQTFSCKLKLHLVDEYNGELRSWKEAMKSVRTILSGLETYCRYLNDCDVIVRCNKCGQIMHRSDQLKSLRYYKLPSVEFNEIVDELYCHQHEHDVLNNNIMYSYFINGPKLDQCFVGSLYLLLNPDLVDNCMITESDTVICKNCLQNVGCVDKAASTRYFPKKNAFRFYHIATDLLGRSRYDLPSDSIEQNFFRIRYETKELYFSWLILSECESYSTLYFVIKTLDFKPRLLVWILDAFTVMALGKLCEVATDQLVKLRPFPAVKVLYKILGAGDLNNPFVNGEQAGVAPLYLPQDACDTFVALLDANSQEMPVVCRTLGNFKVGFLPVATEF